jgi:hypothetical protein
MGASAPLLGEDLFTSAITEISSVNKAAKQSRTGGATSIASSSCDIGKRLAAKSSRTPSMIESRTLTVLDPLLDLFPYQVLTKY